MHKHEIEGFGGYDPDDLFRTENCPSCGLPYQAHMHTVEQCQECLKFGSTACCMRHGTICVECMDIETQEEEDAEDDRGAMRLREDW